MIRESGSIPSKQIERGSKVLYKMKDFYRPKGVGTRKLYQPTVGCLCQVPFP